MMQTVKVQNGTFTIQNRVTKEHRTFRIRTQDEDATFAPGKRVIGLLTGRDNNHDASYEGFGFVNQNSIIVWQTKKGMMKRSAFEIYATMLWDMATNIQHPLHQKYEIMKQGRCVCCNRLLTHPQSIKSGIGPECAKRFSLDILSAKW